MWHLYRDCGIVCSCETARITLKQSYCAAARIYCAHIGVRRQQKLDAMCTSVWHVHGLFTYQAKRNSMQHLSCSNFRLLR